MGRRKQDGSLIDSEIAVLRELATDAAHSYELGQRLPNTTESVRRALVRLEQGGYLRSQWDTAAPGPGPPRHVFTLTAKGKRTLKA